MNASPKLREVKLTPEQRAQRQQRAQAIIARAKSRSYQLKADPKQSRRAI
ncbi:hypothetical protein [Tsukamurella sp. PLM1]|nr:hypothetical protein [Tsukamurella sp. PLM1]BDH58146.1 hypothetical protein MTP03_30850 [Tsukamurella sp. PLM1]